MGKGTTNDDLVVQFRRDFQRELRGRIREAIQVTLGEVSRPGESHPRALSEPCVNLSAHTAPIIQP